MINTSTQLKAQRSFESYKKDNFDNAYIESVLYSKYGGELGMKGIKQIMNPPTEIETLVYNMLTENTGANILDSGGVYGRNVKKTLQDFRDEPSATLEITKRTDTKTGEVTYDEFIPRVSVFHKLTDGTLEIDALCGEFNSLPCDNWDSDIYGVSSEGEQWLLDRGFDLSGDAFNTYNWGNSLSQVLQGTFTKHEPSGDTYVLLQIHGGCDVRGGYTDAKLFKVDMAFQEEYGVYRDDCIFAVDIPGEIIKERLKDTEDSTVAEYIDSQAVIDYLSLAWHCEWLNREGQGAGGAYMDLFGEYAFTQAVNVSEPRTYGDTVIQECVIHGDIMGY